MEGGGCKGLAPGKSDNYDLASQNMTIVIKNNPFLRFVRL